MVVACSDLVLVIGVGPRLGRVLRLGHRSFNGLAKAMKDNFVWNNGIIIRVSGVRVPPPLPFLSIQSMYYSASKTILVCFFHYTPLTHFLVGFQSLKTRLSLTTIVSFSV